MNGNGELTGTETGTETLFLRKLRSSYEILTDERNSYVLLQRKRLNGTETWTWKPGVKVMAVLWRGSGGILVCCLFRMAWSFF